MSDESNSGCGCLPLLCVLTFIVFLTLKLTSVIAWSWWWVTAPLWGYAALVLLIMGGAVAIAIIAAVFAIIVSIWKD